jgi:hypothetical protein
VTGVAIDTRMVVVLGREPGDAKVAEWVALAALRGISLVLLTVGYPVALDQQDLVEAAIERAFELRVPLDATFVPGYAALLDHLGPGDDVLVAATGRDARRIGAALARRVSA